MHKIHKLTNKITLVYEKMPSKSVCVGLWVKSGSLYETKAEHGISHFIEHMLFKGTKNRTAAQISEEMDFVGGQINAYTSKECTCFHTKTLGENLSMSLDILSDMYFNSLFDENELEQERKVILEEISMYEDSPEDVAHELLALHQWGNTPYGRSIGGTPASVKSITRASMLNYFNRRYTPENTVISVAGDFEEERLISLAEKYFGKEAPSSPLQKLPVPTFNAGEFSKSKDIEQTHICIGYKGFEIEHKNALELSVACEILGGGMSSRLFQEVREKHGLCYSIYSFADFFPTAGAFGIYAAMSPDFADLATELIYKVTGHFISHAVSSRELDKVKNMLRCSCIMSSENTASVMRARGRDMLLRGKIRTEEDVLGEIYALSCEGVRAAAEEVLSQAPMIIRLSPVIKH